jgi:DNA-binding GntR family transcriptional regulator
MNMKSKPPLIREPTRTIDRRSYEPAYAQLVNILRQQIAAGTLRPGDQLPSESQLCKLYRVSPMTVRRAINILVDQGVISTAQGSGTFVKAVDLGTATFHLQELQTLFSDKQTSVKLLEARIALADERLARKLAITVGERAIYLRRLLCRNGEPTFYHREYLLYDPTRPLVEAEIEVTSLQGLFEGSGGSVLKHGDLTIEATVLNEEEARLLQVPSHTAAFCLEHVFYDLDNQPISWGWFICRGDRLRFTTKVGIPEASRGGQGRKM